MVNHLARTIVVLLAAAAAALSAPTLSERTRRAFDALEARARAIDADRQARKPVPAGDALFDDYVRAVLASSASAPDVAEAPDDEAQAVLLALALFLDSSGKLALTPMFTARSGLRETPEERVERQKRVGEPTLRGRPDWAAHFVISAAIAVVLGETAAEAMGVQKELNDAREGGSGFSFADLCADLAGVQWARSLLARDDRLPAWFAAAAEAFRGADWFPDPCDLPEGLDGASLGDEYGGVEGEAYAEAMRGIRKRIEECPGYRE